MELEVASVTEWTTDYRCTACLKVFTVNDDADFACQPAHYHECPTA